MAGGGGVGGDTLLVMLVVNLRDGDVEAAEPLLLLLVMLLVWNDVDDDDALPFPAKVKRVKSLQHHYTCDLRVQLQQASECSARSRKSAEAESCKHVIQADPSQIKMGRTRPMSVPPHPLPK